MRGTNRYFRRVAFVLLCFYLAAVVVGQRNGTPLPSGTTRPVPSIPTQPEPDSEPDKASTVIPLYIACVVVLMLILSLLACSLLCLDHIRYSHQSIGTEHIFQSAPKGSSLSDSLRDISLMDSMILTSGVLYNTEEENSALQEIEWQSLCYSIETVPVGPLKKIARRIRERIAARAGRVLPPDANTKPLLFNVSGFIAAGEIVAVMGESGSGKSTLCRLIAGLADTRQGMMYGRIKVNGQVFSGSLLEHGVCAFVAQQTVLSPHLTVYESLIMTARLYQPFETPGQLDKKVSELIDFLGLSDVRDRRLSNDANNRGVSGGQARRINLAEGILSGAKLIILDEPTTGLSATDASNVFEVLYKLAKERNYAIMMIIHQPRESLFQRLDRATIIHQGLCVYSGEPESVRLWLDSGGAAAPPPSYRNSRRRSSGRSSSRSPRERREEGGKTYVLGPDGEKIPRHEILVREQLRRSPRPERNSVERKLSPSVERKLSPIVGRKPSPTIQLRVGRAETDDIRRSAATKGMNTHEVLSKMFASYKNISLVDSGVVPSSTQPSPQGSLQGSLNDSLTCSLIVAQSLKDQNSLQAYKDRVNLHLQEDDDDVSDAQERLLVRVHFTLIRVVLETWVIFVWAMRMLTRYHGALLYALLAGLTYGTIRGIFIYDVGDTVDDVRNRFGAVFITLSDKYVWLPWLAFYMQLKPTTELAMRYGRQGETSHCIVWILITVVRAGLSSVVTTVPTYWLGGLNPALESFVQFLILMLCFNAYSMMSGIFFGALAPKMAGASALTSISLLPFFALSGFFVKESLISAPFAWITSIDPVYYIFERGFQADMGDLEFQCGEDDTLICPVDGEVVLANQDFYYRPLTDWGFIVLWVLIPILLFVWIIVLKACCYRKRTNQFYSQNQFLPLNSDDEYYLALPLRTDQDDDVEKSPPSASGSTQSLMDFDVVGNPEKMGIRQGYIDLLGELDKRHESNGASILKKLSGTGGWGFFQPTADIAWKDLSFTRQAKRLPPKRYLSQCCDYYVPFYGFFRDKLLRSQMQVLHEHCGILAPGQMMAIMGPSGCGKSSLLDMLAGTLRDASHRKGSIIVGGKKLGRESLLDTRLGSYVTQEEMIAAELTVEEALQFACTLHFPSDVRFEERCQLVDACIAVLGLESVRYNIVGSPGEYNISGGQLRRVAIATEGLLKGSRLIFMDEPTSGLSAEDTAELILLLRGLCDNLGYTIVTSIHQPAAELLQFYDKLLVMSKGWTVYSGSASEGELVEYFGEYGINLDTSNNVLDSLIDEVTADEKKHYVPGNEPHGLARFFFDHQQRKDLLEEVDQVAAQAKDTKEGVLMSLLHRISLTLYLHFLHSGGYSYAAPIVKQILVLFQVFLLTVKRNPRLFRMFILQSIILAVFFGGAYFRIPREAENLTQIMGAAYLLFTVYVFVAGNHALTLFDRIPIITYELQRRYYRIFPQVLVILMWHWLKIAIGGVLFATIVWWMVGFRDSGWYMLEFIAAFVATGWYADGLSFFLMFLFSNDIVVAVMLGIITSFMHLVAGFFIDLNSIVSFLQWTSWVSPMRYGAELIFNAILLNATFGCGSEEEELRLLSTPAFGAASADVTSCPVEGTTVLEGYGYDTNIFLRNELILVAEALFMYLLGMLLLMAHRQSVYTGADFLQFLIPRRSR